MDVVGVTSAVSIALLRWRKGVGDAAQRSIRPVRTFEDMSEHSHGIHVAQAQNMYSARQNMYYFLTYSLEQSPS